MTAFRDLSDATDDEVAASFTDPIRDLPADQRDALRDAVLNLDAINAWLGQGAGEMVAGPALTRRQMREQGLICAAPHGYRSGRTLHPFSPKKIR